MRLPIGLSVPVALLLAVSLFGPASSVEAAVGDQKLPNLRAIPAREISFGTGALLRFSTISWNAGVGPLELRAGASYSDGTQDVWQWIALEGGGWTQRLAGRFLWHPDHNHFHLDGYAVYTLQPVGAPGGSSRTSQKTTFCVMDTNRIDGSLAGSPTSSTYNVCGNVVQGMSVGWGDRYGYSLSGQAIDMAGMPDGDYQLIIQVDPLNKLSEPDRSDNTSCVLLRIGVVARTVQVLNPDSCDAIATPTLTGITPNSGAAGTSRSVTISGTGFTSGMALSFVNGNGAAPSLRSVVVVNSTTITANVSVQRKRMGSDPIWDLRTGSYTLANAFTVTA